MAAALNVYKWNVQKSALGVIINLYESYMLFSIFFITNKTDRVTGEHRSGTKMTNR